MRQAQGCSGPGTRPPNPRKTEKRTVPEHCQGPQRARSLTLTRATFWLLEPGEPERGRVSPGGGSGGGSSVTATSLRSGYRGQADVLTVARALRGRAVCGQFEAAVAGMWPVAPIHKSSAEHRWRAGLSRARRTSGWELRRTRRQENKRARCSEPGSCVRGRELRRAGCSAAGAAPGRGGGDSDGASCAAQSPEGGAALKSQAPSAGGGVSRAVAEWPRTPAGFRGRAKREPQRSAPAPGSCDLAAPGAAPSARLPISGRGAGLGSLLGAGARWSRDGSAWAPEEWGSEVSATPSRDDRGCDAPSGAFSSRPRLTRARPPGGGVGAARRKADLGRCGARAAKLSLHPRIPAQRRRVTR